MSEHISSIDAICTVTPKKIQQYNLLSSITTNYCKYFFKLNKNLYFLQI